MYESELQKKEKKSKNKSRDEIYIHVIFTIGKNENNFLQQCAVRSCQTQWEWDKGHES